MTSHMDTRVVGKAAEAEGTASAEAAAVGTRVASVRRLVQLEVAGGGRR